MKKIKFEKVSTKLKKEEMKKVKGGAETDTYIRKNDVWQRDK